MEQQASQSTFQARVFAAYEALHSALRAKFASSAETIGGVLAGAFIVSDSLSGTASALPLAAAIAGACFLGVEADAELARDMLRHGHCDFVVNTLDEALRILKNELRQEKPVSVCLSGNVPEVFSQMAERGVAPDLLIHGASAQAPPAMQRLAEFGAMLYSAGAVDEFLSRGANHNGEITRWTLPHGTAAMLARMDSVALTLMPPSDRMRRRWLEAAQRYVPREGPPTRISSFNHGELERFLDAACARVMSGDVLAPVEVDVAGESMVLGGESGA